MFKALAGIRENKSVSLLMARLPKEKGRAAWEIARSLRSLTERDFGIDCGQWKKWWANNAEGFVPPPLREIRSGPWLPEGKKEERYSFYGLSIVSHQIVFVLDVSGSMAGHQIAGLGEETPIVKLSKELSRAIKGMSGEHSVNMIFFNSDVKKWRKTLVSMGKGALGNRAEALIYTRYLRADGGTNLYGGLKAALEDEETDSVILLSDGDPNWGEIVDKEAILDAVAKRNRVMQARVHVIAIGDADRVFLRRLALDSGGTFKSL